MSSAMDAAVSGLMASQTRLDVHAHNIANANTDGFKASRLTQAEVAGLNGTTVSGIAREESAGTDLATEMVGLITSQRSFEANLATIRTKDEMLGSLLDILA